MNEILIAVIPVVIIGIVCAAVLVVASKLMAVKEDERFPKVRECLPGANCGACGFAGCDGYAKALCENPDTPTNLCIPGADGVSRQLSEVLGVEFADVVEQVAVVHCSGDCAHTQDKVQYEGIESCTAAKLMYGGKGSCTYGCLGMGDCAAVCPHDAICLENGVARVDPRACIGCARSNFHASLLIDRPLHVYIAGVPLRDRLQHLRRRRPRITRDQIHTGRQSAEGDGFISHQKLFVHCYYLFIASSFQIHYFA